MSSYFAEAPSVGGPPRIAGSSKFLDQYTKKRADAAGLLAQAADAKVDAYVADKTAAGPPVSGGRSFDFGAVAQGAAGLAKGLSTAFKPQAAAGEATGGWSSTAGFDLSGSAGSFDTSAFTNPAITNLDFGFGNNFSGTVFGS